MSRPLVFMMGKSPAILPTDRRYARNHMWASPADGLVRVGLSAYAVRLLGDVHHLEWAVEAGGDVAAGGQIGYVEASKATSDLYSPLTGRIAQINPEVLAQPGLMNTNLYDRGWLLAFHADAAGLLSPEQYLAHLEAAWPLAQRLLKGQLGRQPQDNL
mgnify:FL=1